MLGKNLSELWAGAVPIGSWDAEAAPETGDVHPPGFRRFHRALCGRMDGFLHSDHALWVLPLISRSTHGVFDGVGTWNDPGGWAAELLDRKAEQVAFAMDVFGGQYVWSPASVLKMSPEDGSMTIVSGSTVEAFAAALRSDFVFETGAEIAAEWRRANGRRLPLGQRLVPRRPFLLGGDYELPNLVAMEADEALRAYAKLIRQVRNLPDGADVRVKWSVT